jgi:hypothetical protein
MPAKEKAKLKAVIAIVAICAALGFLFYYYRMSVDNPGEERDLEVLAIDIESGQLYEVIKEKGEDFPLTNPDTGQKTLWIAYVCYNEKILFPATLSTLNCPKCGNIKVGSATQDHKEYEVYMPERE